jgi:uncharacterized cupin superfamily protein
MESSSDYCSGLKENSAGFIRINPRGPDGSGLPTTLHDASDTPLTGALNPHAYTAYLDPSGVFTVGVWACDAGTLKIDDLAIDEACYLIEGEVIITDQHGNSERFVAGEAFLLKRGFVGTWHMPYPILKYNAMFKR